MSSSRRKRPAGGRKRLFVVLGMHRSGTSAVARGLQVLGVELGERLMPPAPGNNEKGFFEDVDFNALCREVMQALGRDWDSLQPAPARELEDERFRPIRLRAVELLRERLRDMPVFGLKDPRISVLLPFWRPIFDRAGVDEVSYVICTRHPLSVARSLERRDGFEVEKSCYLWLQHMGQAVLDSAGTGRRVVSYDLLMQEPQSQLARLAGAFDLPFDPRSGAFGEYANDFLSEQLRHSHHDAADLEGNPGVPPHVSQAYLLLEKLARDQVSLDDRDVGIFFTMANSGLDESRPALAYANRLDARIAKLQGETTEAGARLQQLDAALAERDGQVRDLTAIVVAKDRDISELQRAIAVKDGQIHGLNLTVGEREARLETQQAALAEREEQLRGLAAELAAKNHDVAELRRALVAKDGQIHGLNLTVENRESRLESLQTTLAERDAQLRELAGTLAARDAEVAALTKSLAVRDELIADRDARMQDLGRVVVGKDADIATLQHAIAVKDGQIHGLNLTVAERDSRLEGLRSSLDLRERDLALAVDARRNALGSAWRILRKQLEAEAGLVEEGARGVIAAAPGSHGALALARVAAAYARTIRDVATSLDEGSVDRPGEAGLGGGIDAVYAARSQIWRDLASIAPELAATAHAAQADTELNRLRLLDSLRDTARAREDIARLQRLVAAAERALAHAEAGLREHERVLGQFGHQFVARIGSRLDPHPLLRAVVTAPLRWIHRLLGHVRV